MKSAVVKLTVGILVVIYYPQGVLESSDSHEYHQLAINLAEHQVFSRSPEVPFEPETIRTPAYPALISCVCRIVDIHPQAIVPVQILLSTVTMLAGFAYGVLVLLLREGVNNIGLALLVLTVAYIIVVSSGPEAYSRFRAPIMPIVCVIAAGGLISSKVPFSARGESLPA